MKATLNPKVEHQIVRAIERCKRIKLAMAKPNRSKERLASLQAEYDSKMEFLNSVKDKIEGLTEK